MGLRLARQFTGNRVLDYGSGDGTFLAMLMADPASPTAAVGAEMDPRVLEDCRLRLGQQHGLSFISLAELAAPAHCGAFDAIICMEVLEHVVDVEPVLDLFARLLVPTGKLLISVPVETGVPLIVKQIARRVAGWRGLGDYPGQSPYTFREYGASIFAGCQQHIARPIHFHQDGSCFHDHKGFNWMFLRETLAQRFHLEKETSSPLPWLSPHLASQVWFQLRKRS